MQTRNINEALANGLSATRIVAGPILAKGLMETAPEDRTWSNAATEAALCATDKIDGMLATTKFGGWLDQMADKAYVIPQYIALSNNGEIPKTHSYIKVGRDLLVTGLRYQAAGKGADVSAGETGKQKTAAEMLTLVLANSPLSANDDVLRAGAAMSSALSLTSMVNYALNYRKQDKERAVTDNSRNGSTRRVMANPVGKIVEFIDAKAPQITPDHVTMIGETMVGASLALAIARPNKSALATTIYTAGSLLDGVDGSLARHKNQENCGTIEGMLKDVRADKRQEIMTLLALSCIAKKRGNKVAATYYAAGAATAVLPALFRAKAESKGYIVPEDGSGSRVTKATMAGFGIALNGNRDSSDIISALIVSGNLNTARQRQDVVMKGETSEYCKGTNQDPAFKKHASIRHKALVSLAVAGAGLGAAAYKYRSKA